MNIQMSGFSGHINKQQNNKQNPSVLHNNTNCDSFIKKPSIKQISNRSTPLAFNETLFPESTELKLKNSLLQSAWNIIQETQKFHLQQVLEEIDLKLKQPEELPNYKQKMQDYATMLQHLENALKQIDDKTFKKYIYTELNTANKNFINSTKYNECEYLYKTLDYYKELNKVNSCANAYNQLNQKYSTYKDCFVSFDGIFFSPSDTAALFNSNKKCDIITLLKILGEDDTRPEFDELYEISRIEALTTLNDDLFAQNYLYRKYYLEQKNFTNLEKKLLNDLLTNLNIMLFPSKNTKRRTKDILDVYQELQEWNKIKIKDTVLPKSIIINSYYNEYADPSSHCSGYAQGQTKICLNPLRTANIKETLRHELIHTTDTLNKGISTYLKHRNENTASFLYKSLTKESKTKIDIINDIEKEKTINKDQSKYVIELKNAGVSPSSIEYAHKNPKEFLAVAGSAPNPEQYSEEFKTTLIKLGLPEFVLNLPPIVKNKTNPYDYFIHQLFGDTEE